MTVLSEIQIGPIMRKNWKIILGSLHCCSETHAQCLGRRLNMECRQSGIVKNYSLSIFEPSSVVGANSLRWTHCIALLCRLHCLNIRQQLQVQADSIPSPSNETRCSCFQCDSASGNSFFGHFYCEAVMQPTIVVTVRLWVALTWDAPMKRRNTKNIKMDQNGEPK